MENGDIWVFAEQENGALCEAVPGMLAKAHDLKAEFGGRVTALAVGAGASALAGALAAWGAERVIAVESDGLRQYKPRPYTEAIAGAARKYGPSIFLFAATPVGRELAPRVMCALRTGLTADAIDLKKDADGEFVQTTPAFGGNLLANICIGEQRPQMVTVRPGVFDPLPPRADAEAELVLETPEIADDPDYELLETTPRAASGPALKDAKRVVACGRGVKSEEDLHMIAELAGLLDAQIACSRPLADCGWMAHDRQLGQSGCTVKADHILNIGISGSTQYLAGMQDARCIISVNTDPDAPVFGISHYGAAADYRTLLPAVIQKIKESRRS